MDDKFKKAERLKNEIEEIKQCLRVFDSSKNIVRGSGFKDILGIFKIKEEIKVNRTYRLFGRRSFGCGVHEVDIEVPTNCVDIMETQFHNRLKELESQYESIWK